MSTEDTEEEAIRRGQVGSESGRALPGSEFCQLNSEE